LIAKIQKSNENKGITLDKIEYAKNIWKAINKKAHFVENSISFDYLCGKQLGLIAITAALTFQKKNGRSLP
jgi:hypothetical protein